MSQMFSAPKMPALPTTPMAPTMSDAAKDQSQSDILAKRRGRATTLLTGPKGVTTQPTTAAKTLLGQ